MPYLLLILAVLALTFGPYLWMRWTLKRHDAFREDFPGNGAELARHLLDKFELGHVKVVESQQPDHYDPLNKQVSLQQQHYQGRSITAVAVAAHEVGHAIQDMRGERLFLWRGRLAVFTTLVQRASATVLLLMPFIGLLTRAPASMMVMLAIGLSGMALAVLVHLITLPVELDASFGKALPIVKVGGYFKEEDLPAIRQVLRAAAFTYVAASLMSMLNLMRWWQILMRR